MSSRSQSSHRQDQFPKPKDGNSKLLQRLRGEIFQLNFYRGHMAYFVVVILICSVIMYGSGIADNPKEAYGGRLEYIDALFICTSAMTSTGKSIAARFPGQRSRVQRGDSNEKTRPSNREPQYLNRISASYSRDIDDSRKRRLRQHFRCCRSATFLQEEAL